MWHISIDLAGTKIEALVLSPEGRECRRRRVPASRGDHEATPRAAAGFTQHFECVTSPLATAVAGRRQDTRNVRIDIGAKMRSTRR